MPFSLISADDAGFSAVMSAVRSRTEEPPGAGGVDDASKSKLHGGNRRLMPLFLEVAAGVGNEIGFEIPLGEISHGAFDAHRRRHAADDDARDVPGAQALFEAGADEGREARLVDNLVPRTGFDAVRQELVAAAPLQGPDPLEVRPDCLDEPAAIRVVGREHHARPDDRRAGLARFGGERVAGRSSPLQRRDRPALPRHGPVSVAKSALQVDDEECGARHRSLRRTQGCGRCHRRNSDPRSHR